jgi:Domain of unknown function (DUF4386)
MIPENPRQLARRAGALYLINIVLGAFAIGIVPAVLVVPDLATTAHNIAAHELLYRSGLVAHLVVTVTNVVMAVIFYDLFKVVNRRLALLDVFFTLVGTAVEAASLLSQFTPLALLDQARYARAMPAAQLQALVHLPGDLSSVSYSSYGVFYGFDIICVACLVLRSGFLPRAIGVLLAIDAVTYLAYGFANLLAPGLAAHLVTFADLAPLLGEGSFCLWLLVAGVDAGRWAERAAAAVTTRPPSGPGWPAPAPAATACAPGHPHSR